MANVDNPHGFHPIGDLHGGEPVIRNYEKDASDTVVLGVNDLVNIDGSLNGVARAAAGGPFLGATLAFGAASTLTDQPVSIASSHSLYEAQENVNIGTAAEGLNANITVANANTTTGIAQSEIDSATETTTSTLDVKIYQVAPYVDNDGTASFARFFVTLNDILFSDLKAGV